MRTVTLTFFLTLFYFLTASTTLLSQKFNGKIVYTMEYPELTGDSAKYLDQLAKETSIEIVGKKTRRTQPLGNGVNQIIITDFENKTMDLLFDLGEVRINIHIPQEELDSVSTGLDSVRISYFPKEKKKILNYKCKKALVFFPGENEAINVFYTKKISKGYHPEFAKLDGFPLEYDSFSQGLKVHLKANSVRKFNKKELPDLSVPEGYRKMSMTEFLEFISQQ